MVLDLEKSQYERVGRLAAAALCAALALPTAAEPITDLQAATLYAAAGRQIGMPLPEQQPTLHVVSQEQLQQIAGCGRCPARGLQMGPDIYLDETLDFADPQDTSILVHEYIHYLQWAANGPATSCQEWVRRELEAYGVQAQVLTKANLSVQSVLVAARMVPGSCR